MRIGICICKYIAHLHLQNYHLELLESLRNYDLSHIFLHLILVFVDGQVELPVVRQVLCDLIDERSRICYYQSFPPESYCIVSESQKLIHIYVYSKRITWDNPKYIETVSDTYKNRPSEFNDNAKPSRDCRICVPSCSSKISSASVDGHFNLSESLPENIQYN